MAKQRGTSNVPMIMGIIGGVLGFPAALCSGMCTAGITSLAGKGDSAGETGTFYLAMGIVGAILGLIGGVLGKKSPKAAGILMLIAAIISGITVIIGNMLAAIVAILFLIGGAVCFAQKKEDVLV